MGDRRRRAVRAAVAAGDDPVSDGLRSCSQGVRCGCAPSTRTPQHLERTLGWRASSSPARGRPCARRAAARHRARRAPIRARRIDSARDWALDAYVDYHQGRCARHLARWMGERGADLALIAPTPSRWSRCTSAGGWPEADLRAGGRLALVHRDARAADARVDRRGPARRRRERAREARSCGTASRCRLAHERGRALYESARARRSRDAAGWRPRTLDEALGLRGSLGEDALPVAGGTFVGVLLATGLMELPDAFIALRGVRGAATASGRTATGSCSGRS